MSGKRLSVNIDHVATIRNCRGTLYPSIVAAGHICELAGADGITFHLREDRRHIKDQDVRRLKELMVLPLCFEMAATNEMQSIAIKTKPHNVTIVPEKREELTTEGGLEVVSKVDVLKEYIKPFKDRGIMVSLFVEPSFDAINASKEIGAECVEIHTGHYVNLTGESMQAEFNKIKDACSYAFECGLLVHAGHGLYYNNITPLLSIPQINQFNIGHGIIARALFVGLKEAIVQMKSLINS